MENNDFADACWDAFGHDNDDSSTSSSVSEATKRNNDDSRKKKEQLLSDAAEEVSLYLTRMFLSECASIGLTHRQVTLFSDTTSSHRSAVVGAADITGILYKKISTRGIVVHVQEQDDGHNVAEKSTDAAVIVLTNRDDKEELPKTFYSTIMRSVVPGGWLLLLKAYDNSKQSLSSEAIALTMCNVAIWSLERAITVFTNHSNNDTYKDTHNNINNNNNATTVIVKAIRKREGVVNTFSCLWKKTGESSEMLLQEERRILDEVTIGRSFYERSFPLYHAQSLCAESIQRATKALLHHGVVILRDLFPVHDVKVWGDAVMEDLDAAIDTLYRQRGVDLLQPGSSTSTDPVSYRELAMREDLRVDLRYGPSIQRLRRGGSDALLRHHPSVLEITQMACNPKGAHSGGNFGRWNFDGNGPDGSPLPLICSQIGAVISLPGCADQAIHADTPHLFEHLDLPPHYINLFLPAINPSNAEEEEEDFDGNSAVGGTAFLVGSHKLDICDRIMKHSDDKAGRRERLMRLIRPSLCAGDALLFDCRVLHMGLANATNKTATSPIRRPLLYVNMTHKWFIDPKNWEDRDRIFEDLDG